MARPALRAVARVGAYTADVATWLVKRRLAAVNTKLRAARVELGEVEAQWSSLADDAEDSGIRALVAESPMAARDHRDDQRHADRFAAQRERLRATIAELEQRQDALLDELSSGRTG